MLFTGMWMRRRSVNWQCIMIYPGSAFEATQAIWILMKPRSLWCMWMKRGWNYIRWRRQKERFPGGRMRSWYLRGFLRSLASKGISAIRSPCLIRSSGAESSILHSRRNFGSADSSKTVRIIMRKESIRLWYRKHFWKMRFQKTRSPTVFFFRSETRISLRQMRLKTRSRMRQNSLESRKVKLTLTQIIWWQIM